MASDASIEAAASSFTDGDQPGGGVKEGVERNAAITRLWLITPVLHEGADSDRHIETEGYSRSGGIEFQKDCSSATQIRGHDGISDSGSGNRRQDRTAENAPIGQRGGCREVRTQKEAGRPKKEAV